ncbi:hypothetical protein LTI14_02160 [Nesterenkonia sp. YGD6]|uniref:hypothetical protein n=1 Tax=Nesterenkonia sp. YGD6 TaxID=2901231 RepID=UPI001F4C67F2|nr:hypothetical protein [Nesterenkonia sp. YGD6]MCH8562029.1 hypothetical protein [Nesterenkonia sp. YGD6]
MKTQITALSTVALLALTACGGDADESSQEPEDTVTVTAEPEDAGTEAQEDRIAELEAQVEQLEAELDGTDSEEAFEEPASEVEDEGDNGDASDFGTREDPLPMGEVVGNDDWEVTLNSFERNQDGAISAENQFNDPAPDGSSYALANVSYTYLGEGSTELFMDTGFAYVTESGEAVLSSDYSAVTPDELDVFQELFNGGTATGNLAIVVPEGDTGDARIQFGSDEAWFATE